MDDIILEVSEAVAAHWIEVRWFYVAVVMGVSTTSSSSCLWFLDLTDCLRLQYMHAAFFFAGFIINAQAT